MTHLPLFLVELLQSGSLRFATIGFMVKVAGMSSSDSESTSLSLSMSSGNGT